MGISKEEKSLKEDDYCITDPNITKNLSKILNMPKVAKCPKRMWTRFEDELLMQLVKVYNGKQWNKVSEQLQHRSAKQCSDRWNTQLKSKDRFNISPWTTTEDRLLLEIQKQLGNKWTKIAKHIPNRNATSIKNRYRSITRSKTIK